MGEALWNKRKAVASKFHSGEVWDGGFQTIR